jgi:1,4-dihydroxy-2-naphthoate octaprenyltransferase
MLGNWIEVIRTCNLPEDRRMDPVSKWLIITRSCVFSMTLISALIGGLLAGLEGPLLWGRWVLVALGLLLAHAANNMVNDLLDFLSGVDTEDYPRASYSPHPLLSGMVSRNRLIAAISFCNILGLAIAVYISLQAGWIIMVFAGAGFLISVFYVAPPLKFKHRGLGELCIFLIWGPLMIAGTYYALCASAPLKVWICSVPYGLAVTAVLMGKHLDKAQKDRDKRVRTLPVVLGDRLARTLTQLMVVAFYLVICGLAASGMLPWLSLLALVSLPRAIRIIVTLNQDAPHSPAEAFAMAEDVIPKDLKERFQPDLPPEAYPLWPLWYVAWGVWWTRVAGAWFIFGLLLSVVFSWND